MSEERQMVLKMVKEGKITVEEAEALLEALAEEGLPAAEPRQAESAVQPVERAEARGGPERSTSLGAEISGRVRKALESARPGASVGESLRESMREVGRTLREELRGVGADVDGSLTSMVRDLFGLAAASDEVTLSHPGTDVVRLLIQSRRGDARLVRSPDQTVRVTARRQVWSHTEAAAAAWLPHVQVTLTPHGSDLLLSVEPASGAARHLRHRVDLTVQVPEGIGAEIDLKSGDVRVEDLAGDLTARIKSGDLSVGPHTGKVRAEIKSGDVSLEESEDLDLRVVSGDVDVKEVRGAAEVRVTSGDVSLDEVRGAVDLVGHSGDIRLGIHGSPGVRAKTISGDISVTLASVAPGARVVLEAVAGDLSVTVAPGIQAGVRAQATAGGIDVGALPLQEVQRGRGWVEGVLGARDASIEMRAISGDLTIHAGEAGS
ncbi:MAG TPA: DUF4097 family beta strand repeat-containing protein [bacterium]|jgi:DUF4097 and DUF4098 domain-containing protein YvlB|nr:DUF4097 family beta strand repeat-containing protein [bacterium]